MIKSIRKSGIQLIKTKEFPIDMDDADEQAFQDATECFMCGKSRFSTTDKKWMKVRDHDHYQEQSNYRGRC